MEQLIRYMDVREIEKIDFEILYLLVVVSITKITNSKHKSLIDYQPINIPNQLNKIIIGESLKQRIHNIQT